MNMNLCTWNIDTPTKFSEVAQPSQVVAMADAPGQYASTYPTSKAYSIVARHAGRINLLFLGGQVGNYDGSLVGCAVGDPKLPDVSWLTGTTTDAQASQY
jgi:prepilin-type processing-associated H-X9-DG protein